MQTFTLKLGFFFHFAKRDKNVLGIKSTHASSMTALQTYSNEESTYSSVIITSHCIMKKPFYTALLRLYNISLYFNKQNVSYGHYYVSWLSKWQKK